MGQIAQNDFGRVKEGDAFVVPRKSSHRKDREAMANRVKWRDSFPCQNEKIF
jgi:hypothetical protein